MSVGAGTVPASAGASPLEDALATLYRPILLFDTGERWRPVNVTSFAAEAFDGRRHRACRSRQKCVDLTAIGDLRDPVGFVDIRNARSGGAGYRAPTVAGCVRPGAEGRLRDCDRGPTSAIYYNLSERGYRIYIDYWWFIRYNDFAGSHEGDWEGVTVVLAKGPPTRVQQVNFPAHGRSYYYSRGATLTGTRPHVFIARGTHAAYPRACRRRCKQTRKIARLLKLPEGRFDGGAPWGRNSDAACLPSCVLPLPELDADPATSPAGNAAGWNAWRGRWGNSGDRSPVSPGLQGRYKAPWKAFKSKRKL